MVELTKKLEQNINDTGTVVDFLNQIRKELWLDDKGNLCYLNMVMFKLEKM